MFKTIVSNSVIANKICKRLYTTPQLAINLSEDFQMDESYLCNPDNIDKIRQNIDNRKGIGDIKLVNELYNKLKSLNTQDPQHHSIKQQLFNESWLIPNQTHPAVQNYGDNPKVVKFINEKPNFPFLHKEFFEITKRLNLVRTEQLGNVSGSRSYFLLGEMAELEHALIRYFVGNLLKLGFEMVSVPDLVGRRLVESCGMNTRGERSQVYTLDSKLHNPDICLSETSEIALAGFLQNKTINKSQLPLKLCAVSRCYRAETSSLAEERGIYRVHEFTKVEMFVASAPEHSDELLEQLREIQENLFDSVKLHLQILDMPPHELGAQAYRKYDIEAWMPGRNMYGEISSCSNCTDFQSRRLNIKYNTNGISEFVHTLNGTACAIPRLLIALIETHQQKNGTISVPKCLQNFMHGKEFIGRQNRIPELKLIKNKA